MSAADTLVLAWPGQQSWATEFAAALGAPVGAATVRRFPDAESFVRVVPPVQGRSVVVACSLDHPDDKLVPLMLLAAAAREAGAARVLLAAPYLCYMRQDIAFHPGETASARHVAGWLSAAFDGLATVDPHLHRIARLEDVFRIPCRHVRAAPAIAAWVAREVERPLLVGPDEESGQWVQDVARRAGAPCIVLSKQRRGDRDVEVSVPEVARWQGHTPVLVDDIISTGHTLAETIGHLRRAGMAAPVCVAVHALFADGAQQALRQAGAGRVVSCDTVAHPSNRIGLARELAAGMADLLAATATATATPAAPPAAGG